MRIHPFNLPTDIKEIYSTKTYLMSNITLADAKALVQRYATNRSAILKTQYSTDILPTSETFSLTEINSLINQTGCTSFRVYFGMKTDFNICAVLVGVDSQGNDILNSASMKIIEEGQRCPPNCPPTSLTS